MGNSPWQPGSPFKASGQAPSLMVVCTPPPASSCGPRDRGPGCRQPAVDQEPVLASSRSADTVRMPGPGGSTRLLGRGRPAAAAGTPAITSAPGSGILARWGQWCGKPEARAGDRRTAEGVAEKPHRCYNLVEPPVTVTGSPTVGTFAERRSAFAFGQPGALRELLAGDSQ